MAFLVTTCVLIVQVFGVDRPANDDFSSATLLSGEFAFADGVVGGATSEPGEPGIPNNSTKSVWWKWIAPRDGGVWLDAGESSSGLRLTVYSGEALDALQFVASSDPSRGDTFVEASFNVTGGTIYFFQVSSTDPSPPAFELGLFLQDSFEAPENDSFRTQGFLSGSDDFDEVFAQFATVEPGEPLPPNLPNVSGTLWWMWIPDVSGKHIIDASRSEIPVFLSVYSGDSLATLNLAKSDAARPAILEFEAVAGTMYFIQAATLRGSDDGWIALSVAGLAARPSPAWELIDIDGKTWSRDGLKGKVVLVNFWATWCPPCRAETPDLVALQNKYPNDLVIVGVDLQETLGEVRQFYTDFGMNYVVGIDSGVVARQFGGIPAIPTSFLIDRDGAIVRKWVGSESLEGMDSKVSPVLGAGGPVTLAYRLEGSELVVSWPASIGSGKLVSKTSLEQAEWEPVIAPANSAAADRVEVRLKMDQGSLYLQFAK